MPRRAARLFAGGLALLGTLQAAPATPGPPAPPAPGAVLRGPRPFRHVHGAARDASGSAPALGSVLPDLVAAPLRMDRVELTEGSRWQWQRARNRDYLLSMNATDLICEYTSAANMTGTFEQPSCVKMDHNHYYGHYLGHWLSATAQLYNATGEEAVKAAGASVVARLAEVQAAWMRAGPEYKGGYLFPYSIVAFHNLFGPPSRNCAPVCVPFYIYHKIMAGMLDQYELAGNGQALGVALGMAAWTKQAVEGVLATGGQDLWQDVLQTEWGGMNEVLYNLYGITGDEQWAEVANLFNHWTWSAPLAVHEDDLAGNHANTHIPEIIGDARGFELTGNSTKRHIFLNFFDIITHGHSFSTGGSNSGEHWGVAHQLGDQLNDDTEESCTTYNILKVARHAFKWTADSTYFDFYERALLNGLIGNQASTGPYAQDATGFIYMLPLGGGGLQKPWGASDQNLPCCWGTLSETFAKLSDSIYWQSSDGSTLFVNLFTSSSASWGPNEQIRITQRTNYPYSAKWTTQISLQMPHPSAFKLAVRVPFWATSAQNRVWLNGAALGQTASPGTYLMVDRTWSAGDRLEVFFSPALRFEQLDDNRPAWQGVGALMYGGIMLAAVNTSSDRLPIPDLSNLSATISRQPLQPHEEDYQDLVFVARTTCGEVSLIPLMDVTFEKYATYFHTKQESFPVMSYNTSGFSTISGSATDFVLTNGAAVVPNGGEMNIRSGNPGETNQVAWTAVVQDTNHTIAKLEFAFQYVSGYGPDSAPGGSTFALVAMAAAKCGPGTVVATLYKSAVLSHYPFDQCNTCYSPPIHVEVPAGNLNVSAGIRLGLVFENNARNVQLRLPLPLKIHWTQSSSLTD